MDHLERTISKIDHRIVSSNRSLDIIVMELRDLANKQPVVTKALQIFARQIDDVVHNLVVALDALDDVASIVLDEDEVDSNASGEDRTKPAMPFMVSP